jgi:hypothetical protein
MVAFAIAFNRCSQSCKARANADRTLIRIPVWVECKVRNILVYRKDKIRVLT